MFRKTHENDDNWLTTNESRPGTCTAAVLDAWVGSLPGGVVLDLAAGQGIESRYLSEVHGRKVVAYDLSNTLRKKSVYPVDHKDIFVTNYGHGRYAGALIKDAWVFFDPFKRIGLLSKLNSGLIEGGSVLIMSQWSDTRAHIKAHDTDFPQKYILTDYGSPNDWINAIKAEKLRGGSVIAIEYQVDESTFRDEAFESGYSLNVQYYDMGSGLARENRWKQSQQFVAMLTK